MQTTERIRRAFPTDDPPPDEGLVADDCSFCLGIRGALRGRRWDIVLADSLEGEAGSIPQLTPHAFIYYLPAFLMQAIASPWRQGGGSSAALFHTVSSACDPALPDDEWWKERFTLLNDSQRSAVADFVRWAADTLAEADDEAPLASTAQAGLQKYWRRYLSEESRRRPTRS